MSNIKVLRCIDIKKCFRSKNATVKVLNGVSFDLESAEILAIVGLSGSGKTTLLRIIASLEGQDQGEVKFDDSIINKYRNDCALLFQEDTLLPWKYVVDNVLLGIQKIHNTRDENRKIAHDLLKQLGLDRFMYRWPKELSGGERRRIELARALAAEPAVLLLDEPFSNVDLITRNKLYNLILKIWETRKQAVIFTTHNLTEAVLLANRILVLSMKTGKILISKDISIPRPRIYDKDTVEIAKSLEASLDEE